MDQITTILQLIDYILQTKNIKNDVKDMIQTFKVGLNIVHNNLITINQYNIEQLNLPIDNLSKQLKET